MPWRPSPSCSCPCQPVPSELGTPLGTVRSTLSSAEVWAARVGEHAGRLDVYARDLLSPAELSRLRAYRSRESAERYVVTRSLVRTVLSQRLRVDPRQLNVTMTETGKPVLPDSIHFNVSHSADLILLAVSADRQVGIDVERRREVQRVHALIGRWLTDAERDAVARIARGGLTLSEAFLRVWSLKEARLKALGVGIAGAARAQVEGVEAVPLDDLLGGLNEGAATGFVGAVAFA